MATSQKTAAIKASFFESNYICELPDARATHRARASYPETGKVVDFLCPRLPRLTVWR
jgi:hypothetical protein